MSAPWHTMHARSVTMDEGRALCGLLLARASFLCVPWYMHLATEALRFNDAAAADATARPAGDRCDFDASNYTDVAAAAKEDFLVAAGRRLKLTQQLLHEPQHRAQLAILAIVMEPLRRLHVYFLSSAKIVPNMG